MNAAQISQRLRAYQSGMLPASVAPRVAGCSTQLMPTELRLPEEDSWRAEEVLKIAEQRGFDYRHYYKRASTRDAEALRLLMSFPCDGDATDGHAWFLHELLDLVGDVFFAEGLAKENADTCAMVGGLLLFNMGFDHGYEAEVIASFSRRYPRTYMATVAG